MGAVAHVLASVVPLALGGEAAVESGSTGTAVAVVTAISIVAGYVLLFCLWRYVFSAKARERRGEPPDY
jgi:hypothetical protein